MSYVQTGRGRSSSERSGLSATVIVAIVAIVVIAAAALYAFSGSYGGSPNQTTAPASGAPGINVPTSVPSAPKYP